MAKLNSQKRRTSNRPRIQPRTAKSAVYRGKQARTGNSLALRFERALFHSHPEFSGEVEAHVIAPGRMLVVATAVPQSPRISEDPVLASFLGFLAEEMKRSPRSIQPLSKPDVRRMSKLVQGVSPDVSEDLGDEALL